MLAFDNQKFLVIPIKDIENFLSGTEISLLKELATTVERRKNKKSNRYFVVNQDEPYAGEVLKIILEGETDKETDRNVSL